MAVVDHAQKIRGALKQRREPMVPPLLSPRAWEGLDQCSDSVLTLGVLKVRSLRAEDLKGGVVSRV